MTFLLPQGIKGLKLLNHFIVYWTRLLNLFNPIYNKIIKIRTSHIKDSRSFLFSKISIILSIKIRRMWFAQNLSMWIIAVLLSLFRIWIWYNGGYSGRISKQYKRNVYNFIHKTLWTTITVKLFDSMSNIVNISTNTVLDSMFNLDRLGVMWYRSKLRQNINFLRHIWNVPGDESNNQELIHAQQKGQSG